MDHLEPPPRRTDEVVARGATLDATPRYCGVRFLVRFLCEEAYREVDRSR